LSIVFPGEQTQFLENNFFSKLLGDKKVDPLSGDEYYTSLNSELKPEWSEGGNEESSFLTKFMDGLSILKTVIITLINLAVLPITIAVRLDCPIIIRMLVFIPISIIYIISGLMITIRGVNA